MTTAQAPLLTHMPTFHQQAASSPNPPPLCPFPLILAWWFLLPSSLLAITLSRMYNLQWLFRPPPFISWADLKAETVTIENPSAWRAASLDGYTLSDRLQRHTYKFPPGCAVRARSKLIREWALQVFAKRSAKGFLWRLPAAHESGCFSE